MSVPETDVLPAPLPPHIAAPEFHSAIVLIKPIPIMKKTTWLPGNQYSPSRDLAVRKPISASGGNGSALCLSAAESSADALLHQTLSRTAAETRQAIQGRRRAKVSRAMCDHVSHV
ncbi:hypothetical protein Bbelb_108480 [Branchiostoma belcheri]|nr:hypothetical protein Bbelb_108480 [Branchiostoma belcheri]